MSRHLTHLCWLVAAAIIAMALCPAPAVTEETTDVEKISLSTLSKKPAKYVGKEIYLEGVVAKVMKDDKLFVIVDKSACGGCPSKKKCGVFELSVSYKGDLPDKKQTVKLTGLLTEPEEGKYLLKAQKMD